jgi:1,3-beta-glucanosyltransferase GAS5
MKGSATFLLASSLISSTLAWSLAKRASTTVSNPNTPPVSVKGNAFFANNQRFYVRGVDYQPGWFFRFLIGSASC